MGDVGDYWRDTRELRQREFRERRRNNTSGSTHLLEKHGVEFESKNEGAHLVVQGNGEVIDFWPSTGLWIPRGGKRNRGVFNLLKRLGIHEVEA